MTTPFDREEALADLEGIIEWHKYRMEELRTDLSRIRGPHADFPIKDIVLMHDRFQWMAELLAKVIQEMPGKREGE